jgi:quinohemoprotein ethanol dehydrogenase
MRKLLMFIFATGLVAVTTVALASASNHAKRVTPETAYPWLPVGEVPAGTATNNWEYPQGDLAHTNYSALKEINTSNVANLKIAWQASFNGPTYNAVIESAPIVVSGKGKNLPLESGTMFESANKGMVALDPTDGKILWSYVGPGPVNGAASLGFGSSARTESFGNGMVFSGQQDGSVVGLNAKTGAVVWTAQVSGVGVFAGHNSLTSPATTFAPIGKDGIVLAGPNNGDAPMRGHMDALDAKTGNLIWRWFTTPDPGQLPFILTWANPAEAAVGGAAIWTDSAVDTELGMVYFGTGNTYPYTGRQPGKNYFTDGTVALDVNTGKLKWYYQMVHHDVWDYDTSNTPVLFNTKINGKTYKAIAEGNKDGYLFVLNRVNGSKLPNFPIPEVKPPDVNGSKAEALNNAWPTQPEPGGAAGQIIDHCPTADQAKYAFPTYPIAPNGLPMQVTCQFASSYSDKYVVFGAQHLAGINFTRMGFDPLTNQLYVCANNSIIAYANTAANDWHQLTISGNIGGTVSAVDMSKNTMTWQNRTDNTEGYCWVGDTSTAGGLLFTGYHGDSTRGNLETLPVGAAPGGGLFQALDARTGKQLWSWRAPSNLAAPAITYSVNGKQYVAIYAMGHLPTSPQVAETKGRDLLTVFSL